MFVWSKQDRFISGAMCYKMFSKYYLKQVYNRTQNDNHPPFCILIIHNSAHVSTDYYHYRHYKIHKSHTKLRKKQLCC